MHLIESLTLGGAENLLLQSLPVLSEHVNNIVVYMRGPHVLLPKVQAEKVYCLNYKNKWSFFSCVLSLKKIIREHKVDLVHAHLFWPTILARAAKPKRIPLVFSVHSPLSNDAFLRNKLSLYAERITKIDKHIPVFVSESVKKDYENYLGKQNHSYVLYNFIQDSYFKNITNKHNSKISEKIKLVSVGTLKDQKNHKLLIKSFSLLKNNNISLDIYGEGPCRIELEKLIKDYNVNKVSLKGAIEDAQNILCDYDAFILASRYEGFGIAVVEAMASGLPCLLSDINVLHEITENNAIFFDPQSESDCASKILNLLHDEKNMYHLSIAGKERAANFRRETYIKQLLQIYSQVIINS